MVVGRNRAPSWSGSFRKMRCCRTYTLETGGGEGEGSVYYGTLEPRIPSSTPGLVASHRVEMCLPGTGDRPRMYPPVAALGVSMEIHLEKLRVALHTICTMM